MGNLGSILADAFKTEVEMLCSLLGSPYVVQIVDFGITSSDEMVIITEQATGNVEDLVAKSKFNDEEKYRFIETVIDAIEELHNKNYVHRDLKWDNVFYFRNETKNEITLKLADFGFSSKTSRVNDFKGNLFTIAPEIESLPISSSLFKLKINAKPADVYGLSIMISELLELKFPIIPQMQNLIPQKRPTIDQVRTLFLEYKDIESKITEKEVTYVSEDLDKLNLKEKYFIIDSVIAEIKALHEAGLAYEKLEWGNVYYVLDDQNNIETVKLENFDDNNQIITFDQMKFDKVKQINDVKTLWSMINEMLGTSSNSIFKRIENLKKLNINRVKKVFNGYKLKA